MAKGLGTYRQGATHSQENQFNKTCDWQIKFILANKKVLIEKHRKGEEYVLKVGSIKKQSPKFTPGQRAEIDRIYEVVMEKLGFGSYKPLLRKGDFKKHVR